MFVLERVIAERIAADPRFAGWSVRRGSQEGPRTVAPAVEVSLEGAQAADSKTSAANVAVAWGVHLIVRRSDTATEELDAAFAAVMDLLINFKPGKQPADAGRFWSPLRLLNVGMPETIDQGLMECVALFQTSGPYTGQS
ncbi:hypothetical protein [Niveibacterium sp. SC-1]|uniref:hypothetical protein n=1 Tax=Niveibacterium sp. SC-1 TaxID=3135646 RepID=UPI00311D500C